MNILDWMLVFLPILLIVYVGFKTQKYVKDLSDFLAAGRVAGRYVLAVSNGQAVYGLISLVALFEFYYSSGFGVSYWNIIATSITTVFLLKGFIIYRFRETRAMTLSQFFEIRYSRKFRLATGVLQSIAGIVNYGLFPAVGARFIVYYTNLPFSFRFLGLTFSTYAVLMAAFLGIAVLIATRGGQVTIMVTDCLQGVFGFPTYLIIVIVVMASFSWWDQITPTLLERPQGESFLNPLDIHRLTDFNIFFIVVGAFSSLYNMISWSGTQGYNVAAISPHEQKMSRVLGTWRSDFSLLMYVLLAMAAITYLSHPDFKDKAAETEQNLQWKTLNDIAYQEQYADIDGTDELIELRRESLTDKQNKVFSTISGQMRVPVAIRDILPVGVTGIFCAIMIFLMISTDTTYLHSWGSIIIQDVLLPLKKRTMSMKSHLRYLRFAIIGVAIYAFIFSLFFGQVTYILMFFALTGSVWLGGAGAVIIGGLYWKRGTAAGAWASLTIGGILSVLGFIGTQFWVDWIYPALSQNPEILSNVSVMIENISRPFEPIIRWRVQPDAFPLNGQEVFFITMSFSITSYIVVSLLTCKQPFNMDKMLNRGVYKRPEEITDGVCPQRQNGSAKGFVERFVGIESGYSLSDKLLTWAVFIYNYGFRFGLFTIIVLSNIFIYKWPDKWWATYFFIQYYVIVFAIGIVSTVWFSIGTVIDLKKLFVRLNERERNELDDGRVIDNVNADEKTGM